MLSFVSSNCFFLLTLSDKSLIYLNNLLYLVCLWIMKLTKPQRAALELLAVAPKYEGTRTFRRTTAESLAKHGFVTKWPKHNCIFGNIYYQGWMITDKGREALTYK